MCSIVYSVVSMSVGVGVGAGASVGEAFITK